MLIIGTLICTLCYSLKMFLQFLINKYFGEELTMTYLLLDACLVAQCYQIAIDVYAILGYAIIRFHMFCPLATNELYTYAWNTYLYLEASFSCSIDMVDFGFIRNNH